MRTLLLADIDFTLPLENPVLIFAIVLFIILFAPLILNRLRIPHIIGLIMAGLVAGPYGLHLLERDRSIELFGTVGLLYIMFLAGLEIDLSDFKKNKNKSLAFGAFTFLIPMGLGILAGYYVLGFPMVSSVLLASMFASHTLIAYPIVSRFGVTKKRAVNITVGGTMITDTLALLVLAVIAGTARGEIGQDFWIRLGLSVVIFSAVVLLGFPVLGRWFFKQVSDSVSQYIFVLAMVFLAAFLAELAGVEAIIGAFLAGLALNGLIPHTSPLMNRIEFVGNALFIPFFLIGVGMLVNLRIFLEGLDALLVALTMTVVAVIAKFSAAWLTQKSFGLSRDERRIIFGLSNAQAAATLAAVLVGHNIIMGVDAAGEPIRLLNEDVLNGTILMILVTCTISSFAVEKAARNLAIRENEEPRPENERPLERIIIPVSNPETLDSLIELAILIKNPKYKTPLFALHVIDDHSEAGLQELKGKKILERAAKIASSTDNTMQLLTRYDLNVTSGIIHAMKENSITDVILGLHQKSNFVDSFFGAKTGQLLQSTSQTIFIFRSVQPINTLRRYVVAVPEKAEFEPGFAHWFGCLHNIGAQTGAKLLFFANASTIEKLQALNSQHKAPLALGFRDFSDWEDFLVLSREVTNNDLFVIITARKSSVSYSGLFEKLPSYLSRYFSETSFLLIYPRLFDQPGIISKTIEASRPDIFSRPGKRPFADRKYKAGDACEKE